MKALVQRLGRALNPNRRLYFTREGWLFSVLALSIGLVAVNTGHNLFYLLFALLLSVVIVSGILSERVLRHIEVKRHLCSEITARVPFAVTVEVRNPHRQLLSYSLAVSDRSDFFPRRALGYLACLGPGESRSFHYLVRVERRGEYHFGPIYLSTRFPFGLFEKVRVIRAPANFVAYPAHRDVSEHCPSVWGKERTGYKKWRWGEEVLGFRPAVPGDDHRFIHWPTSARVGQLMVKEFLEEVEHPRLVFFDNRGVAGEKFEYGVEMAASLLRQLVGRGVPVSFATWDEYFQPTMRPEGLRSALRHLALLAPAPGIERAGFKAWCSQVGIEGQGIFIGGELSPPPSLPPCEVVQV
ncbi:MAG: DUF58 domain-containing protein [Deltaproteobacteria bacterium]|nr:DUF58 domain-containing protein [Deltaproteobacteria bacterium]